MSLILIKEDGTAKTDANSYASAADGDAYHDGHLYATTWTGAASGTKEKALVMGTRLIDGYYAFHGRRVSDSQALQWPRYGCPDPDSGAPLVLSFGRGGVLPSDSVPPAVVMACCELARELIAGDRTAAPLGEGLISNRLGDSAVEFNPGDRAPVVTWVAQALLRKLGVYCGETGGQVRLKRA